MPEWFNLISSFFLDVALLRWYFMDGKMEEPNFNDLTLCEFTNKLSQTWRNLREMETQLQRVLSHPSSDLDFTTLDQQVCDAEIMMGILDSIPVRQRVQSLLKERKQRRERLKRHRNLLSKSSSCASRSEILRLHDEWRQKLEKEAKDESSALQLKPTKTELERRRKVKRIAAEYERLKTARKQRKLDITARSVSCAESPVLIAEDEEFDREMIRKESELKQNRQKILDKSTSSSIAPQTKTSSKASKPSTSSEPVDENLIDIRSQWEAFRIGKL